MLAKNVNDNAGILDERVACEFFREQARSYRLLQLQRRIELPDRIHHMP